MAITKDLASLLVGPGHNDYGRATPSPTSTLNLDAFRDAIKPIVRRVRSNLADGPLPDPSPEQLRAIEALSVNDGVVKRLSGKPGTGKSTVIRHLQNRVDVTICATTAKAALNVGGITLDRLFVYNRDHDSCRNDQKLAESMERCSDIIVLDEASMLGRKMANYVHRVCRMYKKTLILVGDWAQAQPVKDEWITRSSILNDAKTIFLTQCHRQNEKAFLDALDALGMGSKSSPAYSVFDPCMVSREPDGDEYVRLYATNAMTDAYNRMRIAELPAKNPAVQCVSTATKNKGRWFQGEEERFLAESRFLHNAALRLGARLICTKNDYEVGYVNGDTGTLVDIAFLRRMPFNIMTAVPSRRPDRPTTVGKDDREVRMWLSEITGMAELETIRPGDAALYLQHDRTGELMVIEASTRSVTDVDNEPMMSVNGFPVKVGFAQTIHSVQGATCSNVYVDMRSILNFPEGSRHGLAYVALSRCRTLAGLKIYGWSPATIECDPEVWRLLAPPPQLPQ